jgi:hypothetical protein
MAKNNNAFDNLLASASWGTPESRQAFEELATKEPFLKEAVMLRSDYSRNLDELKPKLAKAEAWDTWESDNWDFEHNMTKAEYVLTQRNLDIQTSLETAALGKGGEVTFDDLNKHLDAKIKALGIDPAKLVKQEDFDKAVGSKVEEARNYNNYTANLATRATYCMLKHKEEFGEILDPNDLFKFAQEKGISDIDDAHAKMVADKRQARIDAKIADEKKAEREAGRKEGLQERAMGESNMPTADGSPDMGHFQKRLLSIGEKKDGAGVVDESVGLGQGVAQHAARVYEQRAIEQRSA